MLRALQAENPGISATEELPAGRTIKFPTASTTRFNQQSHGWAPDVNKMLGNTIPEAPLHFLPEEHREGGLKQYLPMMVGTAVTIGLGFATGGAGTLLGAALQGAFTYAASNAAAQITALSMNLSTGGFDFGSMAEAGATGAVMGGAQFKTTQIGLNALDGGVKIQESMIKTIVMAMSQQVTAQAVQGAFAGRLDMRSMVSNVLAAGVTDGLLQQMGFNVGQYDEQTRKTYLKETAFFEQMVDYTVETLGSGFGQTALASLMSGQPMNSTEVMLNTLTQVAIKLGSEAVQASLKKPEAPVPEFNPFGLQEEDYYRMSHEQLAAAHLKGHSVVAAGQTITPLSDEEGYNRSKQPKVNKSSANKKPSESKKRDVSSAQTKQAQDVAWSKGNTHVQRTSASQPSSECDVQSSQSLTPLAVLLEQKRADNVTATSEGRSLLAQVNESLDDVKSVLEFPLAFAAGNTKAKFDQLSLAQYKLQQTRQELLTGIKKGNLTSEQVTKLQHATLDTLEDATKKPPSIYRFDNSIQSKFSTIPQGMSHEYFYATSSNNLWARNQGATGWVTPASSYSGSKHLASLDDAILDLGSAARKLQTRLGYLEKMGWGADIALAASHYAAGDTHAGNTAVAGMLGAQAFSKYIAPRVCLPALSGGPMAYGVCYAAVSVGGGYLASFSYDLLPATVPYLELVSNARERYDQYNNGYVAPMPQSSYRLK